MKFDVYGGEKMDRLNILWTTSDKETVTNMMSMYGVNALKNGWWDEINIIIWGESTKFVSENPEIQKELIKMIEGGITFEACKACADKLNASEILSGLGVDVKYMGKPLTQYIKSGDKILTI